MADILIKEYGFRELSLADPLKTLVCDILQVPQRFIYGTQDQKREPIEHLGLIPESFSVFGDTWKARVGAAWCGRYLLEFMGTDVLRRVWPEIFVEAVRRLILAERSEFSSIHPGPDIRHLISDVRFQNEGDMIEALGGRLMRVEIEGHTQDTTGHVSDSWYATAKVDHVISAPKPGIAQLTMNTRIALMTLRLRPKVAHIQGGE